ncbi:phenylalanine--tRNA ligase subunit beta [Nicoliella spurrieriana]|uniref:Phenylalanine--tRNA ligase beta subunit n=1 Tax=Nicoliella spurrieriana TaxID=2925830 RepID=A0A976X5G5_9LACO|nr:phenylalanine--tRNA ligase subunit beta [Nicoliella spurrieriana]UQS86686.1 phenylalanine--tRNA ligase subunit beta [Nicoliella spurrieriana]
MLVSYKWLKEYLDLDVPATELAEKIERTAVEVDGVFRPEAGLKKIVVGDILSMENHPDSDHLHVCQVDIGEDEPVQIVCGAPNVQAGKKVIVAESGARVADNQKIKRSKMRGVVSNGMICGLDEIGIDKNVVPKEWADGIYFLPDDAKPGDAVYSYLGMDDDLIDLDVTPNRGDMLSIYGTAHELAAIYDLPLMLDHPALDETGEQNAADLIQATADPKVAPNFNLRVLTNVKVQSSPLWMQIRLWNAGIKPINNVVDATNYIMWKYGQPMHAYDYDQLAGHELVVRQANDGEQLKTLNENDNELVADDIVVADADKPVALAGVMGGFASQVTENTTTIVLESATFDSVKVRKTAQRHLIHTDASQRFERGVDHASVREALDAAAELISNDHHATVQKGIVTASDDHAKPSVVQTTAERINAVLGTNLSATQISSIFERLGFEVQNDDGAFTVTVPVRRWDIHIPADLFEEVARIYGYDNIPSTLPVSQTTVGRLTAKQTLIRKTRDVLEGAGLTHAISYALTSADKAASFMMRPSAPTNLSFPMSSDHTTLRMNLLSGLLTDIAYNQARSVHDVALYEQGRVFYKDSADQARPAEIEHVAGAITGSLVDKAWNHDPAPTDFYQIKGIAELLLKELNVAGDIEYRATDQYPDMHPGRTADVYVHGHLVGFVGQIHPSVAKQYKIKATYGFEFDLQKLIDMPKQEQQSHTISKYPSVSRDIAMLVDQSVTNHQLVEVIKKRGGAYLTDIHLFDIFEGHGIPAGKKSIAYSLTYQNKHDTMVDDDVNKAFDKVKKALQDEFNVTIR